MSDLQNPNYEVKQDLNCGGCGATLKFAPGTDLLKCEYCGHTNEIKINVEETRAAVQEIDFYKTIRSGMATAEKHEVATVKCPTCGAQSTLTPNVTSDECAFCGTSLVISEASRTTLIKPKSLLPFKVNVKTAQDLFVKWIHSLWFAPNKLKKYAKISEKLKGMYIPYWTYDSSTYTRYTGERGDNYTVQETYRDTDGNTRTRSVVKVRWRRASGNVSKFFDDVLVVASKSLPKKYIEQLEPWDLDNLAAFDEKFLSGFQTEAYQVGLEEGFTLAKDKIEKRIRELIRRDIGGDHQRIHSMNVNFDDITFKHILLPLWISAYRYNDKVYRFLVNARTGEVKGERPYSVIKITLAVLAGLLLLGVLYYFTRGNTTSY